MGRVVVGCAQGNENPDAVIAAYLTAGAALDRGDEVVMWLTSDGVRLATNGYVAPMREGMEPPGKPPIFYVCPVCFNERDDVSESDLVENAELKGATPLMEFTGDGATVFNY